MKKTVLRSLIPCCLALMILLAGMPAAQADKLQDALNAPVPFGIAHADNSKGLPVYKTASIPARRPG